MFESLEETAWQLSHLSGALTRAKRLEKLRAEFHAELYECIAYPSFIIDKQSYEGLSTATDAQAIRIIEAKERYDRQIMNEYDRYFRWQSMLDWVNGDDRIILIRYFQKKKYVRPERINSLLHRIKGKLEEEERHIEKARADLAKEEYGKYARAKAEKQLPKRKISIFEDGKWLLKDPDEYQIMQWRKQRDQEQEELRQYFREAQAH